MVTNIHDCLDAIGIPGKTREYYVKEVRQWMEERPEEPFHYVWTGNMFIVGLRHDDGSVMVVDSIPVKSYETYEALDK